MDLNLGIGLGPLAKPASPLSLFAAGEQGAWYDPSDFSTLFQDSAGTTPVTAAGQVVGLVRDKSGRGNHASQTGAASLKPILQQDENGRHYIAFDGVDDFLVTGTINFTATDKMSVFAGVRKFSDATAGAVVELSANYAANAGGFAILAPLSAASPEYAYLVSGDTSNTGYRATGFASPITTAVSGLFDLAGAGRATEVFPRANGSVPGTLVVAGSSTAGAGNFGAYPLYIGRRGGTSLPFNGRLYNLIVRGAFTSGAQLTNTEAFVNAKTGAY